MWDIRTCGTWLAVYVDSEKTHALNLSVPAKPYGLLLHALDLADSFQEVPDAGDGKFPDKL